MLLLVVIAMVVAMALRDPGGRVAGDRGPPSAEAATAPAGPVIAEGPQAPAKVRPAVGHVDMKAEKSGGGGAPEVLYSFEECAPGRRCSMQERFLMEGDFQNQWAATPKHIKAPCRSEITYSAAVRCILTRTMDYLERNPGAPAPWVNPDNWHATPPP